MYDFSHIAKMREEQEFIEPLEWTTDIMQ
jgi:hypothetical protein